MKSFRIALVAGSLGQGGSERQLFYIAKALQEQGCEVRIYALTRGEHYEKLLRELGFEVCWIGEKRSPLVRLASFIRQLRRFAPHVIQTMHSFTNIYAALAGHLVGAVSVGALRCDLEFCEQENGRWTKWLLRLPDALVVNSRKMADGKGAAALGVSPYWLPNCVDGTKFSPRPPAKRETFHVLLAGRLIPVKRGDIFLEALAIARKQCPEIQGWVAGDGPEIGSMRALAVQLGLEPDGVTFLGDCDNMPKVLGAADALVLCSDSEGSANVVLEAMASGVPVISTPAGDAETMVQDSITGYVVGFGDAAGIGRRMVELAEKPELRREFSEAGRRQVELYYDARLLAGKLFALYLKAAQQKNNARTVRALAVLAPTAGVA